MATVSDRESAIERLEAAVKQTEERLRSYKDALDLLKSDERAYEVLKVIAAPWFV